MSSPKMYRTLTHIRLNFRTLPIPLARLFHLRCLFDQPFDIVHTFQTSARKKINLIFFLVLFCCCGVCFDCFTFVGLLSTPQVLWTVWLIGILADRSVCKKSSGRSVIFDVIVTSCVEMSFNFLFFISQWNRNSANRRELISRHFDRFFF